MTLRVWSYAGCSTCRKAKAWLESEGVDHELVPIVEQPPSAAELRALWERSGLPLRRFFNTSGQSYRQGGFGTRLAAMSDDEALAALAADGKLIKRPLAAGEDAVLVGFDPEAWSEAFCAEGARRPATAPSGDGAMEKAFCAEGARRPATAPSGDGAIEKAFCAEGARRPATAPSGDGAIEKAFGGLRRTTR